MAGDVTYTVTNPRARRDAVAPMMASIAAEIAAAASGGTPRLTGAMAGSYSTKPGRDPGTTLAVYTGPGYAKYVEYGTRKMRASAPMGRAFAAAKGRYGG
jgi:hypothetical protein